MGFTAWIAHEAGLRLLGAIPAGVTVAVMPSIEKVPADRSSVRFWSPPFLADDAAQTVAMANQLPELDVIQLMSAGADAWIGRLPDRARLYDARGVHDSATSEWAVAATLCLLRDFPRYARNQAVGAWDRGPAGVTDELGGKHVVIVGAGSIGTAAAARLAPFEVEISLVARTARPGVYAVTDLPQLLPRADVVILLVPLTAQTTGLVDETFLSYLPDGALLVNASRGQVVRTPDLVAELSTGRLRAALDVTDPEPLPADHPLWTMPNVFITPHVGGAVRGLLRRIYRLVGDQLRRYAEGQPLINEVIGDY